MDITYLEETINLSTVQFNEKGYFNNYQNQEGGKLSRYILNHPYYLNVSNNIYNVLFNYYKNMNYSKKETEYIQSLNDYSNYFYKQYEEYSNIEYEVSKTLFMLCYIFIYICVLIQIFEIIKNCIFTLYNFMYKNNHNEQDFYEDIRENSETLQYVDNYVDENEHFDSDYNELNDIEDTEDDILEYDEINTDTDTDNDTDTDTEKDTKKVDTDIKEERRYKTGEKNNTNIKTRCVGINVNDDYIIVIQNILQNEAFNNITINMIKKYCNKYCIRDILKINNVKSLTKDLYIMAFMHTHLYRYYNSKSHRNMYPEFYDYIINTISSYRGKFSYTAEFIKENMGKQMIETYIDYYFNIGI
jgi:hypothetical protein